MRVVFAVALIASVLSACSFHETKTVQPAPTTAAVVVPASPPPTTTVVTTE